MRWLGWSILVLTACDAPCALEQLDECADCGPGEIRRGVRAPLENDIPRPPSSVALGDGGIGCVVCGALHLLDAAGVEHEAIGDTAVVGGTYTGSGGVLDLPEPAHDYLGYDAFIAVFDAAGLVRAHHVGGDELQAITAIQEADDGTVWTTIDTDATRGGPHELVIGSRTFDAADTPRRYVVNLEP
jgi:hypothetical protein